MRLRTMGRVGFWEDIASSALDYGSDFVDFGADLGVDYVDSFATDFLPDYTTFDVANFDTVPLYDVGDTVWTPDAGAVDNWDFMPDGSQSFDNFGTDETLSDNVPDDLPGGDNWRNEWGTDEENFDPKSPDAADELPGARTADGSALPRAPNMPDSANTPTYPQSQNQSRTPVSQSDILRTAAVLGTTAARALESGNELNFRREVLRAQQEAAARGQLLNMQQLPPNVQRLAAGGILDKIKQLGEQYPLLFPAMIAGGVLLMLGKSKGVHHGKSTQVSRRKR